MATSLLIRPQSSRKSIAGTSNAVATDWCCAASPSIEFIKRAAPDKVAALHQEIDAGSQSREYPSSTETAASKQIVPRLVTPSTPTSSIILPDRSLGRRPSLESIKSSSTSGSSIRSNRLFDTPQCSPLWDSPQTSPEQADPIENRLFPFNGQLRNKHRTTNDRSQEAYEIESPTRAAGRREKASNKDRVPPPLQKEASRSSQRLRPPVTERLRSSSAPSVPSPTEFRSSSIDPISLDIERYLIPGIASLTLKDRRNETRSSRTARAASASLGQLAEDYMGRSSSALGRAEKIVTSEATKATVGSGLDSKLGESMDQEVSTGIHRPKAGKESQRNTSVSPSTATIEEREGAKRGPKDSSISSSSVHTTATKTTSSRPRTPLSMQQETIENANPQTTHHTPGGHLGSSSAQESPDNAVSTAGDVPEADPVPEADTVPGADTLSHGDAAPVADEELWYPVFDKFHDDVSHQADTREELMDISKPTKRGALKKLKRGYIYTLSFPSCIHAAGAGTEQTHEYFKVGFTLTPSPKRRWQQRKCGLAVSPTEDEKQRSVKAAGIVDDLNKRNRREYLYAQGKELSKVMRNSPLLCFLSFVGLFLFYTLGVQPGSVCSVLLLTIVII